MYHKPMVTRMSILSMQVCVPGDWPDEQVMEFTNRANLAGTQNGWMIRKEGDKALDGSPERVTCADQERGAAGFVHIMLDC